MSINGASEYTWMRLENASGGGRGGLVERYPVEGSCTSAHDGGYAREAESCEGADASYNLSVYKSIYHNIVPERTMCLNAACQTSIVLDQPSATSVLSDTLQGICPRWSSVVLMF